MKTDEKISHGIGTTRVQVELAKPSMDRLIMLKEQTEAASYSEVLRHALRLYEHMLDCKRAGMQFFVRDESGQLTQFEIII